MIVFKGEKESTGLISHYFKCLYKYSLVHHHLSNYVYVQLQSAASASLFKMPPTELAFP